MTVVSKWCTKLLFQCEAEDVMLSSYGQISAKVRQGDVW